MPTNLTSEQEQRLRDKADKGLLTPEQLGAWKRYQERQGSALDVQDIYTPPVPPPPEDTRAVPPPVAVVKGAWESLPGVPKSRMDPTDPRASSPWYQQLWERAKRQGIPIDPSFGNVGVPAPSSLLPGQQTDWEEGRLRGMQANARTALEWMPTIIAALVAPETVAPGAYTRAAALYREIGSPLLRAAEMYLGQAAAEQLANIVDPRQAVSPQEMHARASSQAVGELAGNIGGRVVDVGAGALNRTRQRIFGETPWGTAHRQVIERLGEHPTIGMASEKHYPSALDVGLSRHAFTGRMRTRYEQVGKVVDDELKRISALHPGTRVTEAGDALLYDIAGRSTPGMLETTPKLAREAIETMPGLVEASLKQGYSNLDANYLSRQVPWHFARNRLPYLTRVEDLLLDPSLAASQGVGAESIFGQTVRLAQNLADLPDQISLDTALDMQRTVRHFLTEAEQLTAGPTTSLLTQSINDKVRPALGQMQQQINEQIAPYLVSLQTAKEHAQKLVATRGIPESVLRGQQASGSLDYTKDADILAAYDLLRQPDFVTFTEAHGLRSDMLKISRLPGTPLIGDSPARQGQMMGQAIDNAMRSMGERLDPSLVPAWRVMDGQYKAAAQLYNSPYIMGVADKNLDDMLTTLVQNERPNDMKALRVALGQKPGGGDVLDDVAQMWLTRKIEAARAKAGPAGILDAQDVLRDINLLTKPVERELFPRGLTDVRTKLWQFDGMQKAVAEAEKGLEANALQLHKLKNQISDPVMWQAVQSDVLSHMLSGGTDPVSGAKLLQGLNNLHKVERVLFDPGHYEQLTHLAHTARALEDTARTGRLHWSPAVRFIEHASPVASLVIGFASGHPLLGAALGGSYVLSAQGLAYLMTNPGTVKLLTQGMSTPISAQRAGDIAGAILGQLNAQGMGHTVTMLPPPGGQRGGPRPVEAHQFPD